MDALYFDRLGTSVIEKTICAAPAGAAKKGLYGNMPGAAFSEYAHARFILI